MLLAQAETAKANFSQVSVDWGHCRGLNSQGKTTFLLIFAIFLGKNPNKHLWPKLPENSISIKRPLK